MVPLGTLVETRLLTCASSTSTILRHLIITLLFPLLQLAVLSQSARDGINLSHLHIIQQQQQKPLSQIFKVILHMQLYILFASMVRVNILFPRPSFLVLL